MIEKYLKKLPKRLQDAVKSMPTKRMDKNQAYNDRKVKALSKKFLAMPQKALQDAYQKLHRAYMESAGDMMDFRDDKQKMAAQEKAVAQLESAWRASNAALQRVHDERKERDEKAPKGKSYLPRAELKKRRRLDDQLVQDLKGWDNTKSNDPIFKVLNQAKKNHNYVRINLIEKAFKHVEKMLTDPHFEEDKAELDKLHKGLRGAIYGRATQAHQRVAFRWCHR